MFMVHISLVRTGCNDTTKSYIDTLTDFHAVFVEYAKTITGAIHLDTHITQIGMLHSHSPHVTFSHLQLSLLTLNRSYWLQSRHLLPSQRRLFPQLSHLQPDGRPFLQQLQRGRRPNADLLLSSPRLPTHHLIPQRRKPGHLFRRARRLLPRHPQRLLLSRRQHARGAVQHLSLRGIGLAARAARRRRRARLLAAALPRLVHRNHVVVVRAARRRRRLRPPQNHPVAAEPRPVGSAVDLADHHRRRCQGLYRPGLLPALQPCDPRGWRVRAVQCAAGSDEHVLCQRAGRVRDCRVCVEGGCRFGRELLLVAVAPCFTVTILGCVGCTNGLHHGT